MAKLATVMFSALLLGLWACRDAVHALNNTDTHTHPMDTPTHSHTLGRWSGVAGRNLSCGSLNEAVRMAQVTMDFIDEFKDDYAHAAIANLSWDQVDQLLPASYDVDSIQVCVEANKGCIPVLPVLPPPPYTPPETEDQTKRLMVVVIGFLQRYSVAADTLVLDQSLSEDARGFLDEMVDLQGYIEDLIDVFLIPLTSCDLTPDPHLVMDLTRRMHQKVDELKVDVRGFMGLRQIRLGLLYLVSVFSEPTRDLTRA